jgi:hypothetical protein
MSPNADQMSLCAICEANFPTQSLPGLTRQSMRLRPNDRHTDFLASAHHGWAGLRAEGLWTKAYQKGASARRRVKPAHNVYVLSGLHPHKQTAKDAFPQWRDLYNDIIR